MLVTKDRMDAIKWRNDLQQDVIRMLEEAQKQYQHAAAMHFKSKCSYEGGRVDALKKVLNLIEGTK